MTIVDLIKGTELQLSPLTDLKAEFEKLTEKFFTDLEGKSGSEASQVKDLIKKYERSSEEISTKYSKQTTERKKNAEAAAKSLHIEAKTKVVEAE